ncbi:MAG TPA: glycosyltransferase [Terriglobales bacterium]|nr:glycosyltransferase [Terriglobales bacterium]
MKLLLLSYPLTAVTPAACGGTEQMAYLLLQFLRRHGEFQVTWVGAQESRLWPAIEFISWPRLLAQCGLGSFPPAPLSQSALDGLLSRCHAAAQQLASRLACVSRLDVIHNLGALFQVRAGDFPAPVLFTLHLARNLYPMEAGSSPPPGVHWQCVSLTQATGYGPAACCGAIPNGIDLRRYSTRPRSADRRAPLLYLGRMCPEKAPHAAIAIARAAHRRLFLVGSVAPFPSHQRYFARQIAPHLNGDVRWLPPPSAGAKRDLLAAAAAVVIPSRIAETSSIVAMEAAACGVPVLAASIGTLPEVVADGITGFVGADAELAEAAAVRLAAIAPRACRRHAERHFDARRMTAAYRRLYRRLAQQPLH